VPELFIAPQIPEATVTEDHITAVIKALAGIAHEKLINFLAGGINIDHFSAKRIGVDLTVNANEDFFILVHDGFILSRVVKIGCEISDIGLCV
jgi:hypothetical protein